MKITVTTQDERIIMVDVDPTEMVENVKAILEVETSTPIARQRLFFNGRELQNTVRLNSATIQDGDLMELRLGVQSQPAAPPPTPSDLGLNPDGSARDPQAWLRHFRNPQILPRLMEQNPGLGQAIFSGDIEVLQRFLKAIHEQQEMRRRAIDDPFDVEAQRRIEQEIQQANIAENEAIALEYNPAQFASVIMLYVMMEVNNHPLKTFVDSGAEITIMSQVCAERAGIMRLCDRRYSGFAMGVGRDRIVGRIHNVQLKIGPNYYMCGVTVLENPRLEFIFGLDMLKRHQCCIDLKENVLRIGTDDCVVPFLPEHEVPNTKSEMDIQNDDNTGGHPSSTAGPAPPPPTSGAAAAAPLPVAPTPTPTPPPPPPAAVAPAPNLGHGPPSQNVSGMEIKIARLMELGFDRTSVVEALTVCNGNEEQAAGILFGG